MTSALDRAGYQLGSGMISPDGKKFLLTVPKNASSLLSAWAGQNNWTIGNARDFRAIEEFIVVLRDPVDRWISGIAQYINTYILHPHGPNGPIFPGELITEHDQAINADDFFKLYNLLVERLLFDVIDRFDDHVLAQADYLTVIDGPTPKKFFLLGQDTVSQMTEYLGWQPPIDVDENAGTDHEQIRALQIFFKDRLTKRPELVGRLYKHYSMDKKLIEQI